MRERGALDEIGNRHELKFPTAKPPLTRSINLQDMTLPFASFAAILVLIAVIFAVEVLRARKYLGFSVMN